MEMQIKKLEKKLQLDKQYTSVLEDCCGSNGFPIAAIKTAAINATIGNDITSDSDEDDVVVLTSNVRDQMPLNEARSRTPKANPSPRAFSGTCERYVLSSNRPEELRQRSPIRTQTKSGVVLSKPVRIAVLKTITNADDELVKKAVNTKK